MFWRAHRVRNRGLCKMIEGEIRLRRGFLVKLRLCLRLVCRLFKILLYVLEVSVVSLVGNWGLMLALSS